MMFFKAIKYINIIYFINILCSNNAYSFPDLIRHGYKSCTTCHASAIGGDILTPYGKSLSQELLSQHNIWNVKSDEKEVDSASLQWDLGGHLRFLQTHKDNSRQNRGRFMVMQLEGDLNLTRELWNFYSSIGRMEPNEKNEKPTDFVYFPQLWMQYVSSKENPSRLIFRLGKFLPGYGINIPEHNSVNRKSMNLQPGAERLNVELTLENEDYHILFDVISSRYKQSKLINENGLLIQFAWLGIDKNRLGCNVLNSKRPSSVSDVSTNGDESALGCFAILGWSERWSQLLQLDSIERKLSTNALSVYSKLSWEWQKGFNFFSTQEYLNDDIRIANPHFEAIGIGLQYFPFAGVDIYSTLRQERQTGISKEYDTVVWMMGHLYL